MRYSYLVFDLDDTLFDYKKAQRHALKNSLEYVGIKYDSEIQQAFSAYNDALWRMHERGEITQERLAVRRFEQLLSHFKYQNIDAQHLQTIYVERLSQAAFLLGGAKEICEFLCKKFPLAIATNGMPFVQHNRLRKSGISGYFQHIFISEEVGAAKPSRKFFEFALEKMGIKNPETALMIGDSLSSDITGGMQVGMHTCWFNQKLLKNDTGILPNFEIHSLDELYKISL